jgi:hypothetical protein
MKLISLSAILSIFVFTATGCFEEEDSCNIKTPGIYVEYQITEKASETKAKVTFWTGDDPGGTYLKLGSCGDAIYVNGKKLSIKGSNPKYYEAVVPEVDSYEFSFERPDEDAYVSIIDNIPEIPEIEAPNKVDVSRAEDMEIVWDENGTSKINLEISGECIDDFPRINGEKVTDDGTYTVNGDSIEPYTSSSDETCSATVVLTRSSTGDLNENLKGTIKGYAVDSSTFTTTP